MKPAGTKFVARSPHSNAPPTSHSCQLIPPKKTKYRADKEISALIIHHLIMLCQLVFCSHHEIAFWRRLVVLAVYNAIRQFSAYHEITFRRRLTLLNKLPTAATESALPASCHPDSSPSPHNTDPAYPRRPPAESPALPQDHFEVLPLQPSLERYHASC